LTMEYHLLGEACLNNRLSSAAAFRSRVFANRVRAESKWALGICVR
jgi:hypothetical protein